MELVLNTNEILNDACLNRVALQKFSEEQKLLEAQIEEEPYSQKEDQESLFDWIKEYFLAIVYYRIQNKNRKPITEELIKTYANNFKAKVLQDSSDKGQSNFPKVNKSELRYSLALTLLKAKGEIKNFYHGFMLNFKNNLLDLKDSILSFIDNLGIDFLINLDGKGFLPIDIKQRSSSSSTSHIKISSSEQKRIIKELISRFKDIQSSFINNQHGLFLKVRKNIPKLYANERTIRELLQYVQEKLLLLKSSKPLSCDFHLKDKVEQIKELFLKDYFRLGK